MVRRARPAGVGVSRRQRFVGAAGHWDLGADDVHRFVGAGAAGSVFGDPHQPRRALAPPPRRARTSGRPRRTCCSRGGSWCIRPRRTAATRTSALAIASLGRFGAASGSGRGGHHPARPARAGTRAGRRWRRRGRGSRRAASRCSRRTGRPGSTWPRSARTRRRRWPARGPPPPRWGAQNTPSRCRRARRPCGVRWSRRAGSSSGGRCVHRPSPTRQSSATVAATASRPAARYARGSTPLGSAARTSRTAAVYATLSAVPTLTLRMPARTAAAKHRRRAPPRIRAARAVRRSRAASSAIRSTSRLASRGHRVRTAHRHGEAVDPGLLGELPRLGRIGARPGACASGPRPSRRPRPARPRPTAPRRGHAGDRTGQRDVVEVRQVGGVDHDRADAEV